MTSLIQLAVLSVLLLVIGCTAQSLRVAKTTKCPDKEYYYMIMVGADEEAICYLCFCKSNITNSVCFKRALNSCRVDTKEYKNNQNKTGELRRSSAARDAFRNMIFNFDFAKEDYCIPYVSGYTNCTQNNICSGCSRCRCNKLGVWDCTAINFCSSNNSISETVVNPRTTGIGSNLLVGDGTTEKSKDKSSYSQVFWNSIRTKRELPGSLVDDIRLASEADLISKINDLPPYLSDEQFERSRITSGNVSISSNNHENETSSMKNTDNKNNSSYFSKKANKVLNKVLNTTLIDFNNNPTTKRDLVRPKLTFYQVNNRNKSDNILSNCSLTQKKVGESKAKIHNENNKRNLNPTVFDEQKQEYTESNKYRDINMSTEKTQKVESNPKLNKSEESPVEFTAYSDVRNRTLKMFRNGYAIGKTSDTFKLEINNTSNDSVTYSNTSISQVLHQSSSKLLPNMENSSLNNGLEHKTFINVLKKVLMPFSERKQNISTNYAANVSSPRDDKIILQDVYIKNVQKIFDTYKKTQETLKKNLDIKQKVIKLIKLCMNDEQCMIGDDTSIKIILLLGQFRQDVFDSLLLDKQIQGRMLNFLIDESHDSSETESNTKSHGDRVQLLLTGSQRGESIELENFKNLDQLTAMLRAYARCINGLSNTLGEIFFILVNETRLDIKSSPYLIDKKPLIKPANYKRSKIYSKTSNQANLKKYALIKMVKSFDYLKKVRKDSLSSRLIDEYFKSNKFVHRLCKDCKKKCSNYELKQKNSDDIELIDRVNNTMQSLIDLNRPIGVSEPKKLIKPTQKYVSKGKSNDLKVTSKKYIFFNQEDSSMIDTKFDVLKGKSVIRPNSSKKKITDLIDKHRENNKKAKTNKKYRLVTNKSTLYPKSKNLQYQKLANVFDIVDQLSNNDSFHHIQDPAELSEAVIDYISSRLNIRTNGSRQKVDHPLKKISKQVMPYLNKKEPLLMNKNSSKFLLKELSKQDNETLTNKKGHFIEFEFNSKPYDEFDLKDQIRDPKIVSETDNKFQYFDKYRLNGPSIDSKHENTSKITKENKDNYLQNINQNVEKNRFFTAENDKNQNNNTKHGNMIEVMKCLKETDFVLKTFDDIQQTFDELIFNLDLNAKDVKLFENCLNLATKVNSQDEVNVSESDYDGGMHSFLNLPRKRRSILSSNGQLGEIRLNTNKQSFVDNSEILAIDYMLALLEAILRKSRIENDDKGNEGKVNASNGITNYTKNGVELNPNMANNYGEQLPLIETIPMAHSRKFIQYQIPGEVPLPIVQNYDYDERVTNIPSSLFFIENDSVVSSSISKSDSLSLYPVEGFEVPINISEVGKRSNQKKETHKGVINALNSSSRYKQTKKIGRVEMNRQIKKCHEKLAMFHSTKTLSSSDMNSTASSENGSVYWVKHNKTCWCSDSVIKTDKFRNEEKNKSFLAPYILKSFLKTMLNSGIVFSESLNQTRNSLNNYTYETITEKNYTLSTKHMVKYINNKKYKSSNNKNKVNVSSKVSRNTYAGSSMTTSLPGHHNILYSTHKSVSEDELLSQRVTNKFAVEIQTKMLKKILVSKNTLNSKIKTHNVKKKPLKGPGSPTFQSIQLNKDNEILFHNNQSRPAELGNKIRFMTKNSYIQSESKDISNTVSAKQNKKSPNHLKVDKTSSSIFTVLRATTFRTNERSYPKFKFRFNMTNSPDLNDQTQKTSGRFTQYLLNNDLNANDSNKFIQVKPSSSSLDKEDLLKYSTKTEAFDLNTLALTEKMELGLDKDDKSNIENLNTKHLTLRENMSNSDLNFVTTEANSLNKLLKPLLLVAGSWASKQHIRNNDDSNFDNSTVSLNMKEYNKKAKHRELSTAIKPNGTINNLEESSTKSIGKEENGQLTTTTEMNISETKTLLGTDESTLEYKKVIKQKNSPLPESSTNSNFQNIPSSYNEYNLNMLDWLQDYPEKESVSTQFDTTEGDMTTYLFGETVPNDLEWHGTDKSENQTTEKTAKFKMTKSDVIDENFEELKVKQKDNFLKYLDYNEDINEKPLPDSENKFVA